MPAGQTRARESESRRRTKKKKQKKRIPDASRRSPSRCRATRARWTRRRPGTSSRRRRLLRRLYRLRRRRRGPIGGGPIGGKTTGHTNPKRKLPRMPRRRQTGKRTRQKCGGACGAGAAARRKRKRKPPMTPTREEEKKRRRATRRAAPRRERLERQSQKKTTGREGRHRVDWRGIPARLRTCHHKIHLSSDAPIPALFFFWARRGPRFGRIANGNQCWLHWIDFKSIPSCTISHSGDISRSFATCSTVSATARSTSSSVLNRPSP